MCRVRVQAKKTVEAQRTALAGLEKVQANAAQTKARMKLAQQRLKALEWEHEVLHWPSNEVLAPNVGHSISEILV